MKTTINKMISKKRILSLAFALTLALGLLTCVTIWSGTAASSVSYLGNANKLYSIKFTVATGTDSYTVTFDANGHGTAPSSQTVTSGGKATEPTAPTADGYTFGGWYKESGCTNKWNFTSDTVTANTTLYAKWTAQVAQVGDAKYTSFSDALSAWNDGTTLTLLSDVTTSSMISVDSGTKTLDLNGHGINANSNCGVIKINSGASLTLNDSDTTTEHKYTISSPKSNGAGLAVVNDSSGSQTFNGGYITGGQTDYGGGILVDNGTLVMNGGTIIGNQATTSSSWNGGGAVLVRGTNGSFTMNGGALIGNTTQCGGAISVTDSSKLIIEGGEIKYNCSTYNGGAINSNGNSTTASITMSGGSITNNWTQGNDYGKGGGVLVSNAELTLSGNPIIADNLCDTSTNNVYLAVEKSAASSVKINGKLGDNANIGVTMYSVGVFTNSTDTTYNDASKFKSDNTSYAVGKNTSGQLFLGYTVTFDKNGHGTAPDSQILESGSHVTEPTAPTETGYTFGGWYTESACTTAWNFTSGTVTENTTLYAKWTADPATAPTISTQPSDLELTYGYDSGSVSVAAEAATDTTYTLSYQWYSNSSSSAEGGTAIADAASESYTIPTGKTAGTTEYYYCVVTATRSDNSQTATTTSDVAAVTVDKADASVTSAPAANTLTYTGSAQALVSEGTAEGGELQYSLDGETYSADVPTATDAGDYTVYYKVAGDDNHNDVAVATVAVTIAKADASVTAPAANSLTYTGSAQALVSEGSTTGGELQYSTDGSDYDAGIPTGTNAGDYTVYYRVVGDDNYNDAAAESLSVTIAKRSVTITSPTASKAYDGTALTATDIDVTGDGFADGEGAAYDVTGTQTLPGSSANTFTYTLYDGTSADNYEITKTEGTLTITDRTDDGDDEKYEITVEANSDSAKYDGSAHSVSGFKTLTFTENGVEYTVSGLSASVEGTDAGSYTVSVTGAAVVKDGAGNDLTAQFIVNIADGMLTISERDVTFTSATDTKVYDGKAMTNDEVTVSGDGFADGEGASYDVTGSQKLVGSSANSFSYTLNSGTKAENYNISIVEGTLTVTSRDAKYEIEPQANSGSAMYDGNDHSVEGFETDTFVVGDLTYTVSGLTASVSGTNAGEYSVNVTGTAVVTDEDGNDVSTEFSVIPQAGTLTISKRSVTLTSASASKVFDGKALTKDEVTVSGDGFAEGESATCTFSVSRTNVGESDNIFTYILNEGTDASNYDIADLVYGRLTVTKADSSCKAPSAKKLVYNEKAQKLVSAGTATGGEMQYSLDGKKFDEDIPTGKDADKYKVYYRVKGDGNHNDLKAKSISVTIEKADPTITDPVANTLKYNGEKQKLVTEGKTDDGTIEYSLDGENFDEAVPEAVEAGDYTVYYRIKGDDNHNDSDVRSIDVSILEADDQTLSDQAYTDFSGNEEFVLDAGDGSVTVSAQGCEGMDAVFELQAVDGGYKLVSTMDNYGRNAEFNISFDKEGDNVSADVSCGEYHSKYK